MAESNSLTSLENNSNKKVTNSSEHSEIEGTIIKDSDEVFEMYCEECNRDGMRVSAYAFCGSCVVYLCSTCLRYHGKFLPGHKSLEGDKMPLDICMEKCQTHNHEILKFYCATCSKFVCSACKIEHHTDTCTMKYLPDMNKDLENGGYLKELITKKNDLANQLSDVKTEIDAKYERIKSTTAEARSTILQEREALFAEFDEDVFQIEEKIHSNKTNDNVRVDTVKEQLDSLEAEIEKMSNDIRNQTNIAKSQKYKLFIESKHCTDRLSKVKSAVDSLTKDCSRNNDTFETELRTQTNDITERVKEFGTMMRTHQETDEKEQKKSASHVDYIYVRAMDDEKDCHIIDCCMLSEQYLIACDKNNTSLKLIDTKNNKLVYVRSVQSIPETVTKINDKEFAMVQSYVYDDDRSKIEFLSLTKAKTLVFQRRYILTEMLCHTVVYINDGRLIISMSLENEGKIQILDMEGDVLENIEEDDKGNKLFNCPFCIALDAEARYAYVTDWYRDKIFEIDLSNYASKDIAYFWHPEGITTDNEGFIFVIESGRKLIHCFHPKDGYINACVSKKHALLDKYHEKWGLSGIGYSVTDNKLYVGYNGHNCIQVYKINDRADTGKGVKEIQHLTQSK